MTTDPPPPPQGNVEDFDFVSAVPHSNHHTVGTASWQNHDSSPPQSDIILHCHGCLCLSNTYISFALWRQCKSKVKSQHICQANPAQPRGLGKAVVTNDWYIIYSLWCTSHENLVFSHPPPKKKTKKKKQYFGPKHKIWHPLIYFSTTFPRTFPPHH